MKQLVIPRQVTPEFLDAIQRNVDAHTPLEKWDLSDIEMRVGIQKKEMNALWLLQSTIQGFMCEHAAELYDRPYSASHVEALAILQKCKKQLERELDRKCKRYTAEEERKSILRAAEFEKKIAALENNRTSAA